MEIDIAAPNPAHKSLSGFWRLFATTFQGAFSDNVLKNLVVFMLVKVLWVLTKTIYRVHVIGRGNIPKKGGALFVCNHVSFVDALLLLVSTNRRMYRIPKLLSARY